MAFVLQRTLSTELVTSPRRACISVEEPTLRGAGVPSPKSKLCTATQVRQRNGRERRMGIYRQASTCAAAVNFPPSTTDWFSEGQLATEWAGATEHTFLKTTLDGTVSPEGFNTWLAQDYLFVCEFTRFVASVVESAPVEDMDLVLGGVVALKDELLWFKEKAAERGIDLDNTAYLPSNTEYCEKMAQWREASYPVKAAVFYAIEVVYNKGWSLCLEAPEPYREFAQRWGNADFGGYCDLLRDRANAALQDADSGELKEAMDAVREVLQLEVKFWNMALE